MTQQQQQEGTTQGSHPHPHQETTAANSSSSQPASSLRPRPTKSEVHSCQFSKWYPTFRNISNPNENTTALKLRKNVTIESHIITPLPQEFVEYLLSDGVRLPVCAGKVSSCLKDEANATAAVVVVDDDNEEEEEDDDGWNDSDNDNSNEQQQVKQYNFPTLTSQIHSTLQHLNNGKGLFPKLNWSSPKDATWMNCGTLKCTTVGDVYLLLKSSEFVTFDLERAWDGLDVEEKVVYDDDEERQEEEQEEQEGELQEEEEEEEGGVVKATEAAEEAENEDSSSSLPPTDFNYELVLRKWCNLHPSMEFRCFIYNHQLIAISQRHPTKFYKHLQQPPEEKEEGEVHPTMEIIHAFYETYVQNRFANGTMHRYIMDVYVDSQERTWIVDFNVWGTRTDALLFDWEELSKIGQGSAERVVDANANAEIPQLPEWRVVTKDMKDLTYDPLSSFRGPTDVMNLMGGAGNDGDGGFEPASFQNFMEQCVRPSEM